MWLVAGPCLRLCPDIAQSEGLDESGWLLVWQM